MKTALLIALCITYGICFSLTVLSVMQGLPGLTISIFAFDTAISIGLIVWVVLKGDKFLSIGQRTDNKLKATRR